MQVPQSCPKGQVSMQVQGIPCNLEFAATIAASAKFGKGLSTSDPSPWVIPHHCSPMHTAHLELARPVTKRLVLEPMIS